MNGLDKKLKHHKTNDRKVIGFIKLLFKTKDGLQRRLSSPSTIFGAFAPIHIEKEYPLPMPVVKE